jgi:hypothetical protein
VKIKIFCHCIFLPSWYFIWNYENNNTTIEINVAKWPAKGRKMTSIHFLPSIALQFLSDFLRVVAGRCSGVWCYILGLDSDSGKEIRPVPLKPILCLANIQATIGNIGSCPQFWITCDIFITHKWVKNGNERSLCFGLQHSFDLSRETYVAGLVIKSLMLFNLTAVIYERNQLKDCLREF